MEQPEHGANCLPDEDAVINIIDELGSKHASARETKADKCAVNDERQLITAAAVNPVSCETSTGLDVPRVKLTSITDWPDIFDLTDVDANVVAYICGYLCMKVNRFNDCADCACSYVSYREKPSYAMFSLCSSIEKVVQLNIESCVNAQHGVVGLRQLFDLALSAVDVYSYSLPSVCGSHQLQQTRNVVMLYLRLRIHHFVRIRNRELKDLQLTQKHSVGKKNSKLEKISHQ